MQAIPAAAAARAPGTLSSITTQAPGGAPAAAAAAARLAPELGGALLDAARAAFLDTFRLSALLASAVLVGTALLCARIQRGARPAAASADVP